MQINLQKLNMNRFESKDISEVMYLLNIILKYYHINKKKIDTLADVDIELEDDRMSAEYDNEMISKLYNYIDSLVYINNITEIITYKILSQSNEENVVIILTVKGDNNETYKKDISRI